MSDPRFNCLCKIRAKLCTVKKEGPNKNRKFYACPRWTCKFFVWADADFGPPCNCANKPPSIQRTSKKENVNKNKKYVQCVNYYNEGSCRYWSWVHDLQPSKESHRTSDDPVDSLSQTLLQTSLQDKSHDKGKHATAANSAFGVTRNAPQVNSLCVPTTISEPLIPKVFKSSKTLDVEADIHRLENILKNTTLVSTLPDQGEKLRERLGKAKESLVESQGEDAAMASNPVDPARPTSVHMSVPMPSSSHGGEIIKPSSFGARPWPISNKPSTKAQLTSEEIESLFKLLAGKPEKQSDGDKINVKGLRATLLDHQHEGLRWLLNKEQCENPRGGILADEMGLGKTMQVIALCLESSDFKRESGWNYDCKATLVICPLAVLKQWGEEFERHTDGTTGGVFLFHGTSRPKDSKGLLKIIGNCKMVITTYGTVETEYRKVQCGHRDAISASPIHGIHWNRIVLDEGHEIKNYNNKRSKAVFALEGHARWVVTGTPIQNSWSDVYSLFAFLRFEPYKELERWKQIVEGGSVATKISQLLKPILLRRCKNFKREDGSPLIKLPKKTVTVEELDFYNKDQRNQYLEQEQKTKELIKKYCYGKNEDERPLVMLLRLRQLCDSCHLVPKPVGDETKDFVDDVTKAWEEQFRKEFDKDTKDSTFAREAREIYEGKKDIVESCPICLDAPDDPVLLNPCCHIYCKECANEYVALCRNKNEIPTCAVCKTLLCKGLTFVGVRKATVQEDANPRWERNAKIDFVMRKIQRIKEIKKETGRIEKLVVFSQWTSMLDIVEEGLKAHRVAYTRMDGKKSAEEQRKALHTFRDNEKCQIFLASLKACGVGLNLTVANHMIIMDPWWNPAIEDQAYDRIYRIGQEREVEISRLVMKGTVEQKILKMQDAKRKMADKALSGKNNLGRKELMSLFT